MGQYYTALAIDKDNTIKKLKPHAFANGAKLMEHSWIGNMFVDAVYSLIYHNPCKVAWIGDYSDTPYDPATDAYAKTLSHEEFMRMYDIAYDENVPSLDEENLELEQLKLVGYETKGTYLVNHDLKCYIDMEAYIKRFTARKGYVKEYCINPLPLLTACGNGRGGGDFRSGQGFDDIGAWAFHRLEYTDQIPEGYSEKKYCFIEA